MCTISPARISPTMEKGSDFHEIFEVFGLGIFNLDFNEWKQERALFHSLLKRNSFKIFLEQNIQKKLENCLLPFLDHHASKTEQILDLQDILERFTFDIAFTSLFGFDSNCLPYNINEFEEIAYVKAISVLEDMILMRHYIPNCIWKFQKWLKIGQEKKGMVAQKNLYEFLNKCIAYYKGDEEKRRLRSNEDVDESNSCLLKELMKEGILEKGEMVEKYIRDTAINLLLAGNGSVSSSLNWFFWLVSTHPIVEAKIILVYFLFD
jgi:cytochrome P450